MNCYFIILTIFFLFAVVSFTPALIMFIKHVDVELIIFRFDMMHAGNHTLFDLYMHARCASSRPGVYIYIYIYIYKISHL
jgi:hypothetical protein